MYTLLNTIKLASGSILVDDADSELKGQLESILRLDFMSHFVFRLFENFDADEDPTTSRFRLEIMVNRGAIITSKEIKNVKDHTVPIKFDQGYVHINKKLNLEKLDSFLKLLESLDVAKLDEESI